MSSSLTLFERQPQSIAVCYLYPLSPSQNTPSCYFVSSALILKALKGKTAEGGKGNDRIYNHVAVSDFFIFFYLLYPTIPAVVIPAMVIVIIFPSNVLRLHPQENLTHHYAKKCRMHFAPSKTGGKPFTLSF